MKKILTVLFLVGISMLVFAQDAERKYLPKTVNQYYGLSFLKIADPYLSPLMYDGNALTAKFNNRRFLLKDRTNLSFYNELDVLLGLALNPARTASMAVAGVNVGTGLHYHFAPLCGFQLLLGGVWDLDFNSKLISRNVNNPANIDLSTNLNASVFIRKHFPLFRRNVRLELQLQSPFVGFMFVPENGASYYEMFSFNDSDLSKAFHMSSFHNKLAYKANFSFSFPFKYSEWQLGLHASNQKHFANESLYIMQEYALTIGVTYDVYRFAGRKNKAPKNFISTATNKE